MNTAELSRKDQNTLKQKTARLSVVSNTVLFILKFSVGFRLTHKRHRSAPALLLPIDSKPKLRYSYRFAQPFSVALSNHVVGCSSGFFPDICSTGFPQTNLF
jgi:hypothetical protein